MKTEACCYIEAFIAMMDFVKPSQGFLMVTCDMPDINGKIEQNEGNDPF